MGGRWDVQRGPFKLAFLEKLWKWGDRKEWLPRPKKNPCTGSQPGCPEHEQLTPKKLLDFHNKTLWQGLACIRTLNVVQVMFQEKSSQVIGIHCLCICPVERYLENIRWKLFMGLCSISVKEYVHGELLS